MPLLEEIVRIACAMWLCASHAYVSLRLVAAIAPRRSLCDSTATFLAVAMSLAAVDFHVLIGLHAYTLLGALILSTLQCGIAVALARGRQSLWVDLSRAAVTARRLRRLLGRSPYRGRVYFFVATSALMSVRTLLQVPNSHDSVVYHAVKAALWLQQSELGAMWGPGAWEIYGVFPAGGEIYTSLAMLPFHHDLLATTVDQLMWLGMGFSAWALMRELGIREPNSSIGSAFILGIPTARLLVGSCYVEPTLCFTFFLGLYFAVRLFRTGRPPLALLALAALGMSASTKYIITGTAAVAGAIVMVRALCTRTERKRNLTWALGGAAVAAALLGPWLLNNIRLTGYPLSPIPLRIAGVTFGVGRIYEYWMNSLPHPEALVWANEWPLLQATFRLPVGPMLESVGIFAAFPLVLAPLGLIVLARRRPVQAAVLALVTASATFAYLAPGMTQVRFLFVTSYSRFLLPLLGLATAAALALPRRRGSTSWVGHVLWVGFVVNAIVFGLPWLTTWDCLGAGLVGAMATLWWIVARMLKARVPGRRWLAVAHGTCAVLFLLGLLHYKDAFRYDILRVGTVLHAYERPWMATAEALDAAVDQPRTVAVTAGTYPSVWGCYHLFGRRLQNRLLYVSPLPDGRIPAFWPSDGWEAQADFDLWLARLRAHHVTDLVFFSPSLELQWVEKRPEVFELASSAPGFGGHYRLLAR